MSLENSSSFNVLHVLRQCINCIIEDLAFMFTEPSEISEIRFREGEKVLRASMQFESQDSVHQGVVDIICTRDLCLEISNNILGVPASEIPGFQEEDVLKELLNILCGKFVTEIYGDEAVFNLSIPDINSFDVSDWSGIDLPRNVAAFIIDDDYPMVSCVSDIK